MPLLFANPEDRFSCVEAHIIDSFGFPKGSPLQLDEGLTVCSYSIVEKLG